MKEPNENGLEPVSVVLNDSFDTISSFPKEEESLEITSEEVDPNTLEKIKESFLEACLNPHFIDRLDRILAKYKNAVGSTTVLITGNFGEGEVEVIRYTRMNDSEAVFKESCDGVGLFKEGKEISLFDGSLISFVASNSSQI